MGASTNVFDNAWAAFQIVEEARDRRWRERRFTVVVQPHQFLPWNDFIIYRVEQLLPRGRIAQHKRAMTRRQHDEWDETSGDGECAKYWHSRLNAELDRRLRARQGPIHLVLKGNRMSVTG